MRILLLAPQPFYRERGTPIANYQMLRALSERENTYVDCLVFHLGSDINLPNVNIHRIPNLKFIKEVGIGFSLKKIICDFFFFFKALGLIKKNEYVVIHAVEEAVFFAMIFKFLYRIPYVYDLDSSIARQLVEKIPFLKFLSFFFNWIEAKAIQGAKVNLPVCRALAELCTKQKSRKTILIPDISLLENSTKNCSGFLKKNLNIDKKIILYIGNLEKYQGIDLLLESFKIVCQKSNNIDLVIIGGDKKNRDYYIKKSEILNIQNRTHFLKPIPFIQLDKYLAEADIVVSPRIRGNNTPMKIFSFLASGKPVIATDIYTHNQLLTNGEAYLVPANTTAFAEGINNLIEDDCLKEMIGRKGRDFIEKNFTYYSHKIRVFGVYDWIESNVLLDNKKSFNSYSLNNTTLSFAAFWLLKDYLEMAISFYF